MNLYNDIIIYTDGSCNPAHCIGGWAAILFIGKRKHALEGHALQTTHQRMELTAVIKALEYVKEQQFSSSPITLYTDSQYVVNLQQRKEKIKSLNYRSKRNVLLPNADLLQTIFSFDDILTLYFVKVKAHQNSAENLNREVDMLCRKIVRHQTDKIKGAQQRCAP